MKYEGMQQHCPSKGPENVPSPEGALVATPLRGSDKPQRSGNCRTLAARTEEPGDFPTD